uniref:Helix-turn-helix domain-containing protein n=1 Tax=uncultured organism MedDCM-OCT-S11-C235 TaxID=743657 RepID=D6PLB6_9ZZZZ|nr:hypothetical protein [uncultured organism MedDCM-OCT-S11-C235]
MATDQTWWALTQTTELKISSKAVLCAMAIISSEKDGQYYFWQRPDKLAAFLGCSRATVYHHITLLLAKNLITRSPNGYMLCVQNPESPVQNPESPVQNPESPVQNPESPVQNPESPVQNPDSYIEREYKEDYEDIMGRDHTPGLVEKKDLRERANMIGVDPAFADEWYDKWYANGVFWIEGDMSKALKPMGCKLGVLVNRLKSKWESERDKWSTNKKRGGRATWDLKQQKENLTELMKEHPGNPKNDGIQEADMETKAEYRKLRNERDQLTKQLAGVSS